MDDFPEDFDIDEPDDESEIDEDDVLESDEDVDDNISVPETKYDESKRENRIIVKVSKKEDRKTSNYMSLFEMSAILGIRAQQIENGDICYVDIGDLTDSISIAKKELRERMCPASIEREIQRKDNISTVEIWEANELINPYVHML